MDNVPYNDLSNTPASVSPLPSKTKVLGVERRLIGFGFGLFLILVILAVLYSVFTRQSGAVPTASKPALDQSTQGAPLNTKMAAPINGSVTSDTVVGDLVDEAVAERDDASVYDADEMADVEDGSNN